MSDYNDGKWHGWNGGECPVHDKSTVQTRHLHTHESHHSSAYNTWRCENEQKAGWFNPSCWDWSQPHEANPIVAFRVVKEHREPREFWVVGDCAYGSRAEAAKYSSLFQKARPIVHVREVIEE
ncbi:hypothetical protein [Paracoccus homiensis]|uniref:Uncharacterized protein n=1 Tax=Paracoccus homiensis TaxID=364199 RepID=A0A1I0IYE6_9RHOB|nr:hypothetical protein [Paracoccus homiensis]SEU02446.1 hypothetical protein SAMN04489858_12016 [Paracoccus homiensis]